jgi:dihydrofolate reductase
MTIISLIAAVDENYGLGKENKLLCHLPADLHYFKEQTLGKPIVMGHKTYQSIGRPLPGRLNIVLSRQSLSIEGVTVVHSLEEAFKLTKDLPEIMVIGGAMIYKQAMPFADRVYLTHIHHCFEADVFFPFFDQNQWACYEAIEHKQDAKNAYDLTFCKYQRKSD